MAKHKVRASGLQLARLLESCGVELDQIPPAEDGWHDQPSLTRGIVSGLVSGSKREPTAAPAATAPVMTPPEAFRTGRITASSLPDWEARHRAAPATTGATLASLAPVLAADFPHAAASAPASKLEAIDDQLFGPTHSAESVRRAHAAQDAEALAAYEHLEAYEREQTANGLTAAEYKAIFGSEA